MAKKNSSKKNAASAQPVAEATSQQAQVAQAEAEAEAQNATLPLNETYNVYEHPVDEITPNGTRTASPEAIESLAKSIKNNGLLNPIVIGTDGRVIAGDSRLAAYKLLGRKTIPVMYAYDAKAKSHLDSTSVRAYAQTLTENLQRSNMTPIETGRAFAKAIAEKIAPDAKSLAAMLNLSTAYISRYMSLSEKGVGAVQNALSEGKITVEAANAIISRAKSDADQVALLENLLKASDGKITIEQVAAHAPAGAVVEDGEVTVVTTTTRRRGRPAGRSASRVTLSGAAMPESGRVSTQLARTPDGTWSVNVTITLPYKGATFAKFDVAKGLQAEIAAIDSAKVRGELEVAREKLGG